MNPELGFHGLPEYQRTKHVHRLHPYLCKFIPQLVEWFLASHFKSDKIGWVDNETETLYLIPQAAYRAIIRYTSSAGRHFPANSVRAMGDALKRAGMLTRTDPPHNAVTVRCERQATKCWAIKTRLIVEEAPATLL